MNKMKVLLVGGAVRDTLLGIKSKDKDYVVVGSTPEEMLSLGYTQVGKDFPVFLHPETGDEHALARTERKNGKGYTGFECFADQSVTLEQDLERRDLTINAIAFDSTSNAYIDPYGGIKYIENRVLRHVSSAFTEDPLRVLRVALFLARYCHLGFKIAPETKQLMIEIVKAGELEQLTQERVWNEIKSALGTQSPDLFFICLKEIGALRVILPQVDALFGVEQPPLHHPEIDAGTHTLLCIRQVALLTDSVETRFGVLLHDLGKAVTPKHELPKHIAHEKAGVPIVEEVCKKLKVPSSFKSFAALFCKEHLRIHRVMELKPKVLLDLLIKLDANRKPERLIQFGIAAQADATGRLGMENQPYPQAEYLVAAAKALKAVNLRDIDFTTERGKEEAHKAKLVVLKEFKETYTSSVLLSPSV